MGRDPHECLRVKVWHERVFAYRHLQIDTYDVAFVMKSTTSKAAFSRPRMLGRLA